MKLLKLLNRKFFILFSFLILIPCNSYSNEPVDIWDLENIKKKNTSEIDTKTENINPETDIVFNSNDSNLINIELDEKIESNRLKLVGLYDPAENDLNLNMWEFSDGEKIIKLVEKIEKIEEMEGREEMGEKKLSLCLKGIQEIKIIREY